MQRRRSERLNQPATEPLSKHPDAGWFTKKVKGEVSIVSKNEHPADALAAVYTGLETDQYRQAVSMMRAFF